jgi:hypothetical protein
MNLVNNVVLNTALSSIYSIKFKSLNNSSQEAALNRTWEPDVYVHFCFKHS